MRRAGAFWLLVGAMLVLATVAGAQPTEIEPTEVPTLPGLPNEYRSATGMTAWKAVDNRQQREWARKEVWPEEAARIARSGQDVVRDDDELHVHLVPGGQAAVVFRNIWGLDPGVFYLYQTFDEVGRFHVVSAGMVDNEGHFLLISARSGLVYRVHGVPVYSPDKTRFLAQAFNGMGCIEGVAVYRYESDKLFKEAESAMGCDQPCAHAWSGSTEITSDCKSASGEDRVQYRLTWREGTWHRTRSPEAR